MRWTFHWRQEFSHTVYFFYHLRNANTLCVKVIQESQKHRDLGGKVQKDAKGKCKSQKCQTP